MGRYRVTILRGARRPGVRSAPAVHGTYFCRGGSQTRPSHLHPWAPVYLFHGDVSPRRRRVTFATAQKSPKGRSGGGVFRFPPPPENPYPAPTNLVLVSSRSLVSPERARLAPSATRPLPMEIACAGFPLGSHFGTPIGCTPWGRRTRDKEKMMQGRNCIVRHPPHHGEAPGEARLNG